MNLTCFLNLSSKCIKIFYDHVDSGDMRFDYPGLASRRLREIYVKFSYKEVFTGTLSNNEQTLTFVFENSDIFFEGLGNTILMPDGTTVDYLGNATIIYTRQ